jgi:hypothetical protein
MTEEMEANDKVFLIGEEVAQYNGAYVSPTDARRMVLTAADTRCPKACWTALARSGSSTRPSRSRASPGWPSAPR